MVIESCPERQPTLTSAGIINGRFKLKEHTENKKHEDRRNVWMSVYSFIALRQKINERKGTKSNETEQDKKIRLTLTLSPKILLNFYAKL